jgi:hypothetical protein
MPIYNSTAHKQLGSHTQNIRFSESATLLMTFCKVWFFERLFSQKDLKKSYEDIEGVLKMV